MRYIDDFENAAKKHLPQIQGNIWIFGAEYWDFVSFCPQFAPMPLFIRSYEREDGMIENIAESAHAAANEVDEIIARIKYQGGDKVREICAEATRYLDLLYRSDEVSV